MRWWKAVRSAAACCARVTAAAPSATRRAASAAAARSARTGRAASSATTTCRAPSASAANPATGGSTTAAAKVPRTCRDVIGDVIFGGQSPDRDVIGMSFPVVNHLSVTSLVVFSAGVRLAKRHFQLPPSYKIKTCISGGPNGTAKSRQLARNHSIV